MPISGSGWELHVVRKSVQQRPTGTTKTRTVGKYQVYHDGVAQTGASLSGTIAEAKGPGKNRPVNNGFRIEEGRYPLSTHGTAGYSTWNYSSVAATNRNPKPAFLLRDTDQRTGILVHPGKDSFLSSVGCFNPCTSLANSGVFIDYVPSRKRVIDIIEDMKAFVGAGFPTSDNRKISNAFVVVDGEP
jgi:hypothetical protein